MFPLAVSLTYQRAMWLSVPLVIHYSLHIDAICDRRS